MYLGLIVGTNINRISNWNPDMDAFDNRLTKWRERSLSIGGRLTLLKSVLEAIPTFIFSIYKAPQKVTDTLEAKRYKFFWGGGLDSIGIPWVS